MGTWGFDILDDDTARDVYDDYIKHFNVGRTREEITGKLEAAWRDTIDDEDEGPVYWIALAKAQWDCGLLDDAVLKRVREIVKNGEGLARWEDEGPRVLAKRKEKLAKFLAALQEANPKPRKPKKPVKRKPVFKAGDCLAVRLSDGDWGAALVLAEVQESEDPADETYGTNIIGLLRYKAKGKPGLEVFERRELLKVFNRSRPGYRKYRNGFEMVGRIAIREDDPKESDSYLWWTLDEQVLMYELEKWGKEE
jgi:hypothetical protein